MALEDICDGFFKAQVIIAAVSFWLMPRAGMMQFGLYLCSCYLSGALFLPPALSFAFPTPGGENCFFHQCGWRMYWPAGLLMPALRLYHRRPLAGAIILMAKEAVETQHRHLFQADLRNPNPTMGAHGWGSTLPLRDWLAGSDGGCAGASQARAQLAQRLCHGAQRRDPGSAEIEAVDPAGGDDPSRLGRGLHPSRRRADLGQLGAACRRRRHQRLTRSGSAAPRRQRRRRPGATSNATAGCSRGRSS